MTDVLHSPSSQNPSSDSFFIENPNPNSSFSIEEEEDLDSIEGGGEKGEFSFFTLFIDLLRKSIVSTCAAGSSEIAVMDIGEPTDVRHVSHVTFDRFDGFLGLPLEFEPEVSRRAPSARYISHSASLACVDHEVVTLVKSVVSTIITCDCHNTSVFGVSTESMQLSFDARGNCVPTILVLMQRRLYAQGGLQEEGIFRITADNSHEEFVREQLNEGVVPDDIDVHCLAGLIKAWFRELPTGVLDPLSPEDVMHCESEEDCTELVKQLPATEGALLNWAINLMADVVQEEHHNRMNAHNVAMVFAPNMTQMVDPLTALMYAVQVMNFLKTLITKALQDREDSGIDPARASYTEPSDDSGHQSPSPISPESHDSEDTDESESESESEQNHSEDDSFSYSPRLPLEDGSESDDSPFHWQSFKGLQSSLSHRSGPMFQSQYRASRLGQTSNSVKEPEVVSSNSAHPLGPVERLKSICNLSRVSSRIEFTESWR